MFADKVWKSRLPTFKAHPKLRQLIHYLKVSIFPSFSAVNVTTPQGSVLWTKVMTCRFSLTEKRMVFQSTI